MSALDALEMLAYALRRDSLTDDLIRTQSKSKSRHIDEATVGQTVRPR
jgi:hypothetical protein